jgi:hypothetical protein
VHNIGFDGTFNRQARMKTGLPRSDFIPRYKFGRTPVMFGELKPFIGRIRIGQSMHQHKLDVRMAQVALSTNLFARFLFASPIMEVTEVRIDWVGSVHK